MKAAELSGILRQIGLTFIVCLVLQVRVDDGRLVLLALQAAALASQLRRLRGPSRPRRSGPGPAPSGPRSCARSSASSAWCPPWSPAS